MENSFKKLFEKRDIKYELHYYRLFQSILWYLNTHNKKVDFECLYDYCMQLQSGFYYKNVNLHEAYIFLDWSSSEHIHHNEAQYFYDDFKARISCGEKFQYFETVFEIIFENKHEISELLKMSIKPAKTCCL